MVTQNQTLIINWIWDAFSIEPDKPSDSAMNTIHPYFTNLLLQQSNPLK